MRATASPSGSKRARNVGLPAGCKECPAQAQAGSRRRTVPAAPGVMWPDLHNPPTPCRRIRGAGNLALKQFHARSTATSPITRKKSTTQHGQRFHAQCQMLPRASESQFKHHVAGAVAVKVVFAFVGVEFHGSKKAAVQRALILPFG